MSSWKISFVIVLLAAITCELWGQVNDAPSSPFAGFPSSNNSEAPLVDLTDNHTVHPQDANQATTPVPQRPSERVGEKVVVPQVAPQDFENGSSLSEFKGRSRVSGKSERQYNAQRFKVYPDDPDSHYWETNVRTAFSRAQREMRPMLLLFTAQWRPEAMNLSHEVFATKSFNNFVKEDLVICYLNYPSNIREAPQSLQWAKKEFKVAGYPNVLIFSPEGEVVRAIRGYRKGRPVDYFNELKTVCAPTIAEIENKKSVRVNQGFRDWKNHEGKYIFGKFVSRNESTMLLQDAYGQNWTVTINQLTKDDQMMAYTFPKLEDIEGINK